ncbi:hypothetical protein Tco_0509568, partial [Tanacetum coccineum]
MILPADHVLRAVINAKLPVPLLLLVCFWSYLFHAVMLPYQVGDVPLTCVDAVDYVSGIHVASSNYWLASFFARLFEMTNFAAKHSIMTPEMVENFCNDYYIPDEVHPVAPGRDKTITQFPEGKVGVYTRFFDYCGYRIPFTKFLTAVLRYFRIHISQLSPFGAARVSYFEVLTRVLDLAPSVQAVEVQKKDDQVKLLESTSHCFIPLVTPATGGSSSVAAPEVSASAESRKSKRKRLGKQSDTLPAKQLRKDHPSFATGTGGKTLVGLRQLMPTSSRPSFQADIQAHVVQSAQITDVPVYTVVATVTSAQENVGITPTSDVSRSSQLEISEGSDDSFYELPALNYAEAKRWYVPRWNITNDSLLDDVQRGGGAADLSWSEVRSRAEHELELKEKLKGRYDARGRLLEEKDLEILKLKSLLAEEAERAKIAEVVRFRDQVSVLTAEVSALKITISRKDTDISLLDSRATHLKSALDDSQASCAKTGSLITSLTSERDRLSSEVYLLFRML